MLQLIVFAAALGQVRGDCLTAYHQALAAFSPMVEDPEALKMPLSSLCTNESHNILTGKESEWVKANEDGIYEFSLDPKLIHSRRAVVSGRIISVRPASFYRFLLEKMWPMMRGSDETPEIEGEMIDKEGKVIGTLYKSGLDKELLVDAGVIRIRVTRAMVNGKDVPINGLKLRWGGLDSGISLVDEKCKMTEKPCLVRDLVAPSEHWGWKKTRAASPSVFSVNACAQIVDGEAVFTRPTKMADLEVLFFDDGLTKLVKIPAFEGKAC